MDAQLGIFTVDGTNKPHVVRLFPQESCSCPARTSCYHVTAARLAVGLSDIGTRHPLNLTQLRRNKWPRAVKTFGRKHPRRRRYRACRWRRRGCGNSADCHHHGEPAAAAAAAISNSCGRGTKQPAGAKFLYTNVQTGNAGRQCQQRRRSLHCLWSWRSAAAQAQRL